VRRGELIRLWGTRTLWCLFVLGLAGCAPKRDQALSPAAELGKLIFKDVRLSGSGAMSCATCHDPALGHASPFTTAVAPGGAALDQPGKRLPPTIRYLRFNPAFHFDAEGKANGGFNWDGSANSLAEQARRPFLSADEMANASPAALLAKLSGSDYAPQFKAVFGQAIFKDTDRAFEQVLFALQRFQIEDPELAPFTSKFDAVSAGRATFSAQEQNGLTLFEQPDKGNCAACHPSTKPDNAPAALFTDFSYDNLGTPRNAEIAANTNPAYFDLGLCGPQRSDLQARRDLCGAFKVPTLRNVAIRKRYLHNGKFDSLEEVIRFYVQRDIDPKLWYPKVASDKELPYDDLPLELRGNVGRDEGPYDRKAGEQPALNEAEIQDLLAFLRTLTDGYPP
jgi:cytochrome c peroxidase